MKVFGLPVATDVARVLACLFEKDVEFELIRIDTYMGDHKVPEFLRLQDPSGQVTLKDGKLTLTDSREICRHIAMKHADKGNIDLLASGALERSSIEQWLHAEAESFDPPSSDLVFHLAFALPMGMRPDKAVIERSEKQLSQVLDVYDMRLSESKYLGGDEFTLADLTHLPNSHYMMTMSERARKLFNSRKNVDRWWKAISARPSWRKVVEMQSEHPGPLEKFEHWGEEL